MQVLGFFDRARSSLCRVFESERFEGPYVDLCLPATTEATGWLGAYYLDPNCETPARVVAMRPTPEECGNAGGLVTWREDPSCAGHAPEIRELGPAVRRPRARSWPALPRAAVPARPVRKTRP